MSSPSSFERMFIETSSSTEQSASQNNRRLASMTWKKFLVGFSIAIVCIIAFRGGGWCVDGFSTNTSTSKPSLDNDNPHAYTDEAFLPFASTCKMMLKPEMLFADKNAFKIEEYMLEKHDLLGRGSLPTCNGSRGEGFWVTECDINCSDVVSIEQVVRTSLRSKATILMLHVELLCCASSLHFSMIAQKQNINAAPRRFLVRFLV